MTGNFFRKVFYSLLLVGTSYVVQDCDNPVRPDLNEKPVISNLKITPENPIIGEDLAAQWDFYDKNGDPDHSRTEWYRNNFLTGVQGPGFPSDSANAGDKVKARGIANDGEEDGNSIYSNEVEYNRYNSAPSVNNVDIGPDDATLEDMIQLSYDYNDAENDPDHSIIEWYNNNTLIQTGGTTLAANKTSIGDTIKVNIKPYDGELEGTSKTSDSIIIQGLPLINISGNITELFNEGVNISGANVAFGEYSTTTDAQGGYILEVDKNTGAARLIINHPNFYERQTSSFAPKDTTLNETMVEDDFNMEHYNLITRYVDQGTSPGTQRWVDAPTVYIDTSPAPNGGTQTGTTTTVTQANIDTAISVIKNLPQFAVGLFPGDTVNIEIGTNPPEFGTEGYIIHFWDNTTPGLGGHAEWVSSNIINSAYTRVRTTWAGRSTYIQELTQNMGARNDSDIVTPSILNQPSQGEFYFEVDLKTGKLLYSRPPGHLSVDKDK